MFVLRYKMLKQSMHPCHRVVTWNLVQLVSVLLVLLLCGGGDAAPAFPDHGIVDGCVELAFKSGI